MSLRDSTGFGGLASRLLSLLVLFILPVVAAEIYNAHSARTARDAEAHERALQAAKLASSEMSALLDGVFITLAAVAKAPVTRSGSASDCQTYLKSLADDMPQISGIGVYDLNGQLTCGV